MYEQAEALRRKGPEVSFYVMPKKARMQCARARKRVELSLTMGTNTFSLSLLAPTLVCTLGTH